ncbi:Lrp/AsnC family transcriptional regulator [Solimicrobium silvestre]|uniref:Transcriptional regulator n=1 Tax=Solimicrobium silvestre TaxID=2099400 RepID=A0A2S9GTA0_9BURK|nr:Lrp/AsnC family transcriptional regulator [Solimicrobium silvestre]PRC90926.1 Transcriptional regulator [Solimicrobium silvestre]
MIDKIDREIIEFLRKDARISYKDLGEKVFLSANAVAERMRRLEQSLVIQGYQVKVNLQALELPLIAIIDVKLALGITALEFETRLQRVTGIIEAILLTGSFDYMLRVACHDQDDLVRLTEELRAKCGVQDSHTRLLLRSMNLENRLAHR